MTPSEVKERVRVIKIMKDDEGQHFLEDQLYVKIIEMLAAIPNDTDFTYFDLSELVECARIALKVREMDFERWYA